jgi:hypothetical protein
MSASPRNSGHCATRSACPFGAKMRLNRDAGFWREANSGPRTARWQFKVCKHASAQNETPNSGIKRIPETGPTNVGPFILRLWIYENANQTASSSRACSPNCAFVEAPRPALSPDVEVIARAIAQGIAEGRRHGLEIAQSRIEG